MCQTVQWTTWTVILAVRERHVTFRCYDALTPIPMLYMALRPALRKAIIARTLRWWERKAAMRRATTLASFIGSLPPGEAMKTARRQFRCIRHGLLTFDLVAGTSADWAKSPLAPHCALGSCDAFISHSFQDDGAAKWHALQVWGAAFAARQGAEPRVWLDSACIEYTRRDLYLQCLPIFLKDCKRLVVLCGPNYLSCFWCIVQIFIYVYVGGNAEDIELVQVLRPGSELEDAKAIEDALDNFDADHCQCSDSVEQQHMLELILVVCGSRGTFNSSVQGIIEKVKPRVRVPSCRVPAVVPRA